MMLTTQRSERIIFKLGPNPQVRRKTTSRFSFLENRVLLTASSFGVVDTFTRTFWQKGTSNVFEVLIISFPYIIERNKN